MARYQANGFRSDVACTANDHHETTWREDNDRTKWYYNDYGYT